MEARTAYSVRQLGYEVDDRGIMVRSSEGASKLFFSKAYIPDEFHPASYSMGIRDYFWSVRLTTHPPPNTMMEWSYTPAADGLYLIGLN